MRGGRVGVGSDGFQHHDSQLRPALPPAQTPSPHTTHAHTPHPHTLHPLASAALCYLALADLALNFESLALPLLRLGAMVVSLGLMLGLEFANAFLLFATKCVF